ncbi:MAG TPA: hypothetical protein OQH54_02935 [Nitrosopumilus sp.]|nr:hypothetical protein [Thermoproteota archaeon]HJJ22654.1 hypothetical protein [Nitrosopumilus sp.]
MDKSTHESKDIFGVSKKNIARFFDEIEKSSPKYQQSVAKLQQDYIDAWKTVINSAISLEEEYAIKAGYKTQVPESVLKTIRDITDISLEAYANQNKINVNTSEATKQAFKTFNQNTKSFATLNKEIMGYIMSVFEQKINT